MRQFVQSLLSTNRQQQQLLQTFLSTARHNSAASVVDGEVMTEHAGYEHRHVLLQLVHAETGETSANVYSFSTALLSRLFECSGHTGSNVLLNMLRPPAGFASPTTDRRDHNHVATISALKDTAAATSIRLLKYDGKHSLTCGLMITDHSIECLHHSLVSCTVKLSARS